MTSPANRTTTSVSAIRPQGFGLATVIGGGGLRPDRPPPLARDGGVLLRPAFLFLGGIRRSRSTGATARVNDAAHRTGAGLKPCEVVPAALSSMGRVTPEELSAVLLGAVRAAVEAGDLDVPVPDEVVVERPKSREH